MFDPAFESPFRGLWLLDADRDIASYIFDITDPSRYPLYEIRHCAEIEEAIENFKKPFHEYARSHNCCHVPDSEPYLVDRFFSIVTAVRDRIADCRALAGNVTHSIESYWFDSKEFLPEPELVKRRWFLTNARRLIHGGVWIETLVKTQKITETNLHIWATTYLTHGPLAFFRKPKELTAVAKRAIAEVHFTKNNANVVKTCAQFGFLNQNRLKRYLQSPSLQS